MTIDFFCLHWGSEHLSFAAFLEKVKNTGYQGVEMIVSIKNVFRNEIIGLLNRFEWLLIARHWETIDADFERRKGNYKARLLNLARCTGFY